MMNERQVLSFIRRLAPFESIWLILVKVLLINKVSGRQVIDLIKNPSIEDYLSFSWWAKGSIDQGRLEDTLGFQRGALDDSFLTMIPRDHLHYAGPQVWHCPSCIKIGYHSSIFCLQKIQSCPWHGDKLVSCPKCYELLNLLHLPSQHSRSFPSDPERVCPHISSLAGRFVIPDFSAPIFQVMSSWYRDFTVWLAASKKLVGGDIFRWIESRNFKHDLDDMILRYLDEKLHVPKPFNARLSFPVARLSLEYSFEREGGVTGFWGADPGQRRLYDIQCMAVVSISKIDQIRCVKSLRRYLWKTYISKHRKCLRAFVNLTLHQRMHLQRGSSCFTSLAYVCWLMNALTTNDLALALGRGHCTYSTYGSRDHCPLAEFKNSLNNKLVRFYSVWGALLIGTAESGDTVVKFHNLKVEQTLNSSFSCTYKDIPWSPSPDDSEEYGAYFVSPFHLKELSDLRCGCTSVTADYVPPHIAEDTVERFYPDAASLLKFIDPQKSNNIKNYIYL
ncbi:hypothetical protein [Pseudomonas sp. LS-2]|uniref:hypothetical protein n=1 Tax=Pseudomonas sp. LS-2 TaxID=2315859 RepID=UPI001058941D|nr:hypothetical protein [Pseudomonas sp. LS-2]